MVPKLKSEFYVQALIRRAQVGGADAYLVRRGAEEAGAIFLKVNRLDGRVMVLSPARRGEERVWTKPLGDEADEAKASAYFERQMKFDPDIWIVEIEDREGRAFVDEPIL
jgi:hypothetical protein